jgi:hypothetical protein
MSFLYYCDLYICRSYDNCVENGTITIPCPAGQGGSDTQQKYVPVVTLSCHIGMSFKCTISHIIPTGFVEGGECVYPNPRDCHTYTQCSVNVDGRTATPYILPCKVDLAWSQKEGDYPDVAGYNKFYLQSESM